MLDCSAPTQAPLAAEIDDASSLRRRGAVTLCCRDRDSSRMGRRRDRRHVTLGGGGRRMKLDLWADEEVPSKPTENVANDQTGGDESQFDSAGVPSPRQQTDAGPVVENPLSLLGQYSDEDLEDGDQAEEHIPEKETRSHEVLAEVAVRPVDEQVENFMAKMQTTGLLEEEAGGAQAPAETVPPQENGHRDWQDEASASMLSDKTLGVDDKLLSPTNGPKQPESGPSADDVSGVAEGWKAVMHAETGRYYFWNTVTGETTWESPVSSSQEEKPSGIFQQQQETGSSMGAEEVHATEAGSGELVVNNVVHQDQEKFVESGTVIEAVEGITTEKGSSIHAVQPVQHISECSDIENAPALVADQSVALADDTQANTAMLKESSSVEDFPLLQEGEVEVKDQGHNQGVEISTDISCPKIAVDTEDKLKKMMEWGQSVASRLETLAGEALQSLPILVRSAIEASIRVSDCRSLASQGILQESFVNYAESHLTRLEAMISTEEAATTADVGQKGVVDRILERNFVFLHAATPNDFPQTGSKTGFRALRPPLRTEIRGELEDSVVEQLPFEADAHGARLVPNPADGELGDHGDIAAPREPLKPRGAESPYREHMLEAEQHSKEHKLSWSEADSTLVDANRDVDMDVDMELDDASGDAVPLASVSTPSTYPSILAANFLHLMQVGYPVPRLLPAYSVPMTSYPDPFTYNVWQPPPPPLPAEDWVPPPPPDAEIAPPPPPDEPPPPVDFSCEASAPAVIRPFADTTVFSYSSAPNMYYYHPTVEGYGVVNGTVNGSWTGMLGMERSELRADQAHDSSLKSQPEENVLKASSPVTEAGSMASADTQGASAGGKKASKAIRVKKRPHASTVSTTLRSNKKVSNLVNKWIAAKEELQESEEEDEDKALFDVEAIEKKRQKEIEDWRRQQLASGGALENANFQPLGILDWRERVKRAKKVGASEDDRSSSQAAAVEASPAADSKQETQKPDLEEINKGLPAGWQAFWDSSSEEVYYGNLSTQETSWDRPQ